MRATRLNDQPYRRLSALIFAASPTGNRVIAYDPSTRWTGSLELHATKGNPLKSVLRGKAETYKRYGDCGAYISRESISRGSPLSIRSLEPGTRKI